MKNDYRGLIEMEGDVTYVPHQNWQTDTLSVKIMVKNFIFATFVFIKVRFLSLFENKKAIY